MKREVLVPPEMTEPLGLGELIDDFVRGVVEFDMSCIHIFTEKAAPQIVHDGLRGRVAQENRELYESGTYILDPTYQHFVAGAESGFFEGADLVAARTTAGKLLSVGAFHPLLSLDPDGVAGHVAFMERVEGGAVAYSLLRMVGNADFSPDEEKRLRESAKYVGHLLRRYASAAAGMANGAGAAQGRSVDWVLEDLLARDLPPRQCSVVCLSLQGYSLDDIGIALNISPNTARAHLQGAYRRLGVRNRGEVFAIILDRIGVSLGTGAPVAAATAAGGRGSDRTVRRIGR